MYRCPKVRILITMEYAALVVIKIKVPNIAAQAFVTLDVQQLQTSVKCFYYSKCVHSIRCVAHTSRLPEYN